MVSVFINLAGAVALLVWGAYMVKTGILRTFGESLRSWLAAKLSNRVLGFFAGFGLSALLQSSTASALLIAGLQSGGLVTTAIALAAVLGADVGSAFMVRVLTLDLSQAIPVLLVIGTVLFVRKTAERSGQFGRTLLGIAFILLALQMIMSASASMKEGEAVRDLFTLFASNPALSAGLGILAALCFFSSLAVVASAAAFCAAGVLPTGAALWVVLGANLGSALLAVITTTGSSRMARKAPLGNCLFRSVGFVLGVCALLAIPPLSRFFIDFGNGSDAVILFHLLYNAIVGVIGLFFVGPAARFIDRKLPAKERKDEGEVQILTEENLLSAKTSLKLAREEILKTIEIFEHHWETLRTLLSMNPPAGEMILIENRMKLLDRRCRAVQTYLAAVVRLGLSNEESSEWNKLSAVNDALAFSAKVTRFMFKSIRKRKWRDSRFFSPSGEKELERAHDEVHEIIEKLDTLLKDNTSNQNKETIKNQLINDDETRGREAFDLVVRHMNRVSSGQSGAIETSALHVELLNLYRRVDVIFVNAIRIL
ncbi:Na/Pi cotransporter family protein [Sutterella sp.]|uniref:Na/Pi cotransporter family protein n=1 Tax=Sutterella sp. TaxID=1981025 RepID=UPI0026DF34A0|nr:Na/Pi symporter [Sutterella sp.]MDO5531306.1 Na/Pi symporter [Sutterella sp.]